MTTRGTAALIGGLTLGVVGGVVAAVGSISVADDSTNNADLALVLIVGGIAAYIGVMLAVMGSIAIGVRWGMLDRDDQRAIDAVADE